jgi:diphosphomevalonate decarboxylase
VSEAQAPSNIALIKYMGKIEGSGNRPTNASISYAAPHLVTACSIESIEGAVDEWGPLHRSGFGAPNLSAFGQQKFLNHLAKLKDLWGVKGHHRVRSANNFPSDCGMASSASSFAALTKAAAKTFARNEDALELSRLSRQGSGSSCRSFFEPWALWKDEGAEPLDLGYPDLLHAAIVVSAAVKTVSTSEAHRRVPSSPKFAGRPERANQRARELTSALKEKNWFESYRICWDEFVDMHELFESSVQPFGYRTPESTAVVDACKHIWNFKKDGPLVTMDAGPNVHLFFRADQRELADKMTEHFRQKFIVMTSWRGLK